MFLKLMFWFKISSVHLFKVIFFFLSNNEELPPEKILSYNSTYYYFYSNLFLSIFSEGKLPFGSEYKKERKKKSKKIK